LPGGGGQIERLERVDFRCGFWPFSVWFMTIVFVLFVSSKLERFSAMQSNAIVYLAGKVSGKKWELVEEPAKRCKIGRILGQKSSGSKCDHPAWHFAIYDPCRTRGIRMRHRRPRRPAAAESIYAMLGQSPVDAPEDLIRASAKMGSLATTRGVPPPRREESEALQTRIKAAGT
jgi:hypothetical protein